MLVLFDYFYEYCNPIKESLIFKYIYLLELMALGHCHDIKKRSDSPKLLKKSRVNKIKFRKILGCIQYFLLRQ